jgi:tetratricopeptide (TPR) repeat protein
MKRIILFYLVIFFIFNHVAFAQAPEEIYRKANLSYENEDYEKAISLYEMLLKMDRFSPDVFYNLGNSYFKLKKIGKAVLNYERALRLAPRDRDIKLNLKLARSMVVDKIESPDRGFILSLLLHPYDRMNINELSVASSFFYITIIALLLCALFFAEKRKTIFYIAGIAGFFLIVFTIFLVSKIHNEQFEKEGVVISEKVDVRSGPKEDYLLQFSLHEGTQVQIVEERQDWFEIELSKDLKGWLPKDSVELL